MGQPWVIRGSDTTHTRDHVTADREHLTFGDILGEVVEIDNSSIMLERPRACDE